MQSNKTTIIITTAILILTLLSAGCTDTGGANPETTTYTPPPQEESPVVEETVAVEPAPEPVETPWYMDKPGFDDAQVGTYSILFDGDIDAVKTSAYGVGNYDLFNTQTAQHILTHQEWTPSNLRLDLELSSDQYRTLNAQYGYMISVTMEKIDLDQDGAMDKVAVKYVGTKGEFTVALFACTVDTSNYNSNEPGRFDMAFKLLPTRISCDDVKRIHSTTLLDLCVIDPNDEWFVSNFERLY